MATQGTEMTSEERRLALGYNSADEFNKMLMCMDEETRKSLAIIPYTEK